MTDLLQQLRTQTDLALNDDGDVDQLIADLDAQIELHPDVAALYRMRAELHSYTCFQYYAWRDWLRVVELDPTDRAARLELAKLQHRRADRLAEAHVSRMDGGAAAEGEGGEEEERDDEEDCDDEEEDGDEEDDVEDERIAPLAEALEKEAVGMLRTLGAAHAADLPFLLSMLELIDEHLFMGNWDKYALILDAQVAHPDSLALRKVEARFLVAQASDLGFDVEQAPSGYFEDINGGFLHALTVDKAMAAIDAILAIEPDAGLMFNQGDFLAALDRFPEAAAAFMRAAVTLAAMHDKASEDERETLSYSRDEALEKAALCARGRAGFIEEQFAAMKAGIDQLAQLRGSTDISQMDELATLAEQSNAELAALEAGPDPSMRTMLAGAAKKLATSMETLVVLEPIKFELLTREGLGEAWSSWFDELDPELRAAGMTCVALFHNPANSARMGQTQGQLWIDEGGATALTAEAAGTMRFLRTVTEFSDGTMIMTANVRGLSFWENAESIDSTLLERDAAVGTIIMIHQKLVARRLAQQPGMAIVPVRSLAELEALEERVRVQKNAFRLAHEITDVEIQGLNVQFRDVFAQMLRAELKPLMARLRASAAV